MDIEFTVDRFFQYLTNMLLPSCVHEIELEIKYYLIDISL